MADEKNGNIVDHIFKELKGASRAKILSELAEEYARKTRQVNERLQQVMNFVRKGLIPDAVYYAETEPNVLDQAAELDGSRLGQWRSLCKQENFEYERLYTNDIEQINEAYVIYEEVKETHRVYRQHILSRACAATRITILRVLVDKLPMCIALNDDLSALEGVRLREIEQEQEVARETNNIVVLNQLWDELRKAPWVHPQAGSRQKSLEEGVRFLVVQETEAKLTTIAEELYHAYSAGDDDEMKLLRDRWLSVQQENKVSSPPHLSNKVAVVLKHLRQIEQEAALRTQFDEACGYLRQMLLPSTELSSKQHPELTARYQNADVFEWPIPDDLQQEYRQRMDSLQLRSRRKTRMIIASAAVLAIFLITAVGWMINRIDSQRELQEWVGKVSDAAETRTFSHGKKLVKIVQTEQPEIYNTPEFQEAQKKLDVAIQVNESLRVEFAGALEDLKKVPDKAIQYGKLSRQERNVQIEKLTEKANLIVGNKEELQLVSDLVTSWDKLRKDFVIKIEPPFSRKTKECASEIRKALDVLGNMARADVTDASLKPHNDLFDHVSKEVVSLEETEGISPEMKARVGGLRKNLARLKADIDRKQQIVVQRKVAQVEKNEADRIAKRKEEAKKDAFELIWASANNLESYSSSIKSFLKKYPNSPHAPMLNRVLKQAPQWEAILAWKAMARPWKNLFIKDSQQRDRRIKEIDQFIEKHAFSPLASTGQQYRTYLTAMQQASKVDAKWKKEFREYLKGELFNLKCFLYKEKYYYVSGKITKDTLFEGLEVPVITTWDFTESEGMVIKPRDRGSVKNSLGLCPQGALASKIEIALQEMDTDNFHLFPLQVGKLIVECKRTDPILKMLLLGKMIEYTKGIEYKNSPGYQEIKAIVSQEDVEEDEPLWMIQGDASVDRRRTSCQHLFTKKFKPWDTMISQAETLREELVRDIKQSAGTVRVLRRGAGKKWTLCPSVANMKGPRTILRIVPLPREAEKAQWEKIGTFLSGRVDIQSFSGLFEGESVFLQVARRTKAQ
jgi:hypothetical protein